MRTPNILLVTIDCLRADRLGVLGSTDGLTPGLDRLACDGACFSQAFANGPKTVLSFPSILTSTYALQYADGNRLSDQRISLAQVLQEAGFHTAGFGSNPFLVKERNYMKGFAKFEEFRKEAGGIRARGTWRALGLFGQGSRVRRLLRKAYRGLSGYNYVPYVRAHLLNEIVLEHLKTAPQPFFAWIHYMDPHRPYAPVPEYMPLPTRVHKRLLLKLSNDPEGITPGEQRLIEKVYDAEVRYQDRQLSLLLEALEASGLLDNLMVIVTADHGEEFREHGDFFHGTMGAGDKVKLYPELLHVPLIIWSSADPSLSGRRIDELVSLADIAPTIVDWLGLQSPTSWVGNSLVPVIRDGTPVGREAIFAHQGLKHPELATGGGLGIALRLRNWTFIYNGLTQQHELYDRIHDPGEMVNLYRAQPDVARRLESRLMKHIETCVDPEYLQYVPDLDDLGADEEILARLRGLGYVE